ncbi:MAG: LD-carboxypeptidase [Paludibacter sp.]|nr:LD-carboxypeptidase [Paludibacter sp.]
MSEKQNEIRIISPSGAINPEYIDGATKVLTEWGYNVTEGRFARAVYGRFAGTEEERIKDLQDAIDDDQLVAIVCSRGGYGLTQIIDAIDFSSLKKYPKWLIGFSDVTVLHSFLSNHNIPSIHGVMAKQLTELAANSISVNSLKSVLSGELPVYEISHRSENRNGYAKGKLIGGNLSVLMGLRGTPYDLIYDKAVLFIEDVGERAYHIDRMLQNLRLGGVFSQLSGLIVGHFTDCDEDPLMKMTIREIILKAVANYDFPVCSGFPAGHEDENYSLILGREIQLTVTSEKSLIDFR